MTDPSLLSRRPLPVTLAGETFLLPWRPAAEWADCLNRYTLLSVNLAEPKTRNRMAALLLDVPGTGEEIQRESYRLLSEQTGRKWWEALRLLANANSPEALGHLTLEGVDPWSVSVGQWCAATYVLYTRNQDMQGRLKFDFTLSIPPEGFDDEWDDGADDVEAIAAAVAGLMG